MISFVKLVANIAFIITTELWVKMPIFLYNVQSKITNANGKVKLIDI